MFRKTLPTIVAFTLVVSINDVGAQTGQKRFEKLYSDIVSAEFDQLEPFDDQLDQMKETKSDLTLDHELSLRAILCNQLGKSEETDLAIRVAKKILAHSAFESEQVSLTASGAWKRAAETLHFSLPANEQLELFEELKAKFLGSKQSVWFRFAQVSTLAHQSFNLRISEQGRELIEEHLPILLNEISKNPPQVALYNLWRMDSILSRVRVPSALRLQVLEAGSAKSESAMRVREGFDLGHFYNLWRFRVSIAQIQSQLSNTSDVLSTLDEMDEFLELQLTQIGDRYSEAEINAIMQKSREFHEKNISAVKQLAADGEIPNTDSLLGKIAPPIDLSFTDTTEMPWKDLKGKIVVLDFWAVWCAPCVDSFPDLRVLHERYAGEELILIGVTRRYGYHRSPIQ